MRSMRGMAGLAGALLLLSLPLPAAADTSAVESGLTGTHQLVDTADSPGAWCGYVWDDEYPVLFLVRVEPPVVFARDRTGGRDTQRVSWRVILTFRGEDGARVLAVSRYRRARAWDDTAADLARAIVLVPFGGFEEYGSVRAWVDMRWHAPGEPSTIEGWSRHRVDFHLVSPYSPVEEPRTVSRCALWGAS